jgi:uncharacterized protein YndB with AHSA1/START domain
MSTQSETAVTTQVYRVYIKASAEAIWEAITDPEWTKKYGYHGRSEYDLRAGGAFRGFATAEMIAMGTPEVVVDGEVIEAEPPRKLVQTWRFNWSPELVEEGFSRVTWEIDEEDGGITQLTVTHELDDAPLTAAQVASIAPLAQGGGGWTWILSDLKTLLETGESIEGPTG